MASVGDGWRELAAAGWDAATAARAKIVQTKEKFAHLRIYVRYGNPETPSSPNACASNWKPSNARARACARHAVGLGGFGARRTRSAPALRSPRGGGGLAESVVHRLWISVLLSGGPRLGGDPR